MRVNVMFLFNFNKVLSCILLSVTNYLVELSYCVLYKDIKIAAVAMMMTMF